MWIVISEQYSQRSIVNSKFRNKKFKIKSNKMRNFFGKMEFSKIKFLLIKMIDILNKLSCIAYKCKDIYMV